MRDASLPFNFTLRHFVRTFLLAREVVASRPEEFVAFVQSEKQRLARVIADATIRPK